MSVQYSDQVRNAQLDAITDTIGGTPMLRFYSGSKPASCAVGATGTLLLEMTLPSTWMEAAAAGVKSKSGTWTGLGLSGAGAGTNAGYWRIYAGSVCHMQGTITATGGGGDMTAKSVSMVQNQRQTINTFSLTAANG